MNYLQPKKNIAAEVSYIRIKVIPKSPKTELVETMSDGTLKIRVKAPPEKGKANKELIRFLAEHFGTHKESIAIISGKTDHIKLIKIA